MYIQRMLGRLFAIGCLTVACQFRLSVPVMQVKGFA